MGLQHGIVGSITICFSSLEQLLVQKGRQLVVALPYLTGFQVKIIQNYLLVFYLLIYFILLNLFIARLRMPTKVGAAPTHIFLGTPAPATLETLQDHMDSDEDNWPRPSHLTNLIH